MKRRAISLAMLVCLASALSAAESFQLTIPFRESSPHQIGEVRINLGLDSSPNGAQLVVFDTTTVNLGQTVTVNGGDTVTFEALGATGARIIYRPLSKFAAGNFCQSPAAGPTDVPMRFSGPQDIVEYRVSSYAVGSSVECSKVFKRVGDFPALIVPVADAVAPELNALFVGRNFLDVVLVLDKSGSMSGLPPGATAGPSKAEILKSALAGFIAQWQEIDAPIEESFLDLSGDRIGVVFFDSTATAQSIQGADAPANFFVRRGPGAGQLWNAVSAHVDTLSPGGTTTVGGGINVGMQQWLNDADNDLIVVVVTDGIQNTAPLITPDANGILLLDPVGTFPAELRKRATAIQTIGFGTPSGVDQALLQEISLQTNGVSFLAVDASTFFDVFGQTLVNILKGNTISSALRRSDTMTGAGPSASQPLIVDKSVPRVVVSLQWAPPLTRVLDFDVLGSDGTVLAPTSTSRTRQAVIQRFDIKAEDAGDWSVRVKRAASEATQSIPYTLNAFLVERDLEYRVRLDEHSLATGDDLTVKVNVTYDGKALPKLPNGAIRVRVNRPAEALGTILHTTPATDTNLSPTVTNGDTVSAYHRRVDRITDASLLSRISPRIAETIILRDSGEGDGLYTGTFSNASVPGMYAFEVLLDWTDARTGHVRREERLERHVKVRPDPQATQITMTPADGDRLLVAVTPRDRFGNYLGPGYGSRVTATVSGARVSPPVDRDQTGTYVFEVTDVPAGTTPDVDVTVDGVPIDGSTGGSSTFGKWRVFLDAGFLAAHDGLTGFDGVLSVNAGIERRLSPAWSAELIGGRHKFQRSRSQDPAFTQLSIGGKRWFGSGALHPFVSASIGAYRLENSTGGTRGGASGGAGLLYDLSPRWGAEASYNLHLVNGNRGNMSFSTLQLGVRFAIRP